MNVEFACDYEGCPGHTWDETGNDIVEFYTWWTEAGEPSRATGAIDVAESDCPMCGQPGDPTGEFDS